jgi:hypothetical protein
MIDENLAHDPGRNAEEVNPVSPSNLCLIDQTKIGFVHQGRGL